MVKNCPMRHENGNCLPAGGFCTANKNICEALLNAYGMGKAQLSQEGTTKGTTFSCSHENDTISRQAAIDALDFEIVHMTAYCDGKNEGNPLAQYNKGLEDGKKAIEALPSAQPENQVHLCDSCRHVYPECPSEKEDVIFGNGKGNDNICACNKYEPSAQPEQKWIPCDETVDVPDHEVMACDRYGEFIIGYLDCKDEQWLCESDGGLMYDPVAWCELPKPYKEEGT